MTLWGPGGAGKTRLARELVALEFGSGSDPSSFAARLDIDEKDEASAMVHLAEARGLAPKGWARLASTMHVVDRHLAMTRGDADAARIAYREALATSRSVEVGFEAVTPASLALAEARAGSPERRTAVAAALAEAHACAKGHANPALDVAIDVLQAGAKGASRAPTPSS